MSCERQKRARICRHSDKSEENTIRGILFEDIADSLFMVAPPPRRTKLNFSRHTFFNEGARDDCKLRMSFGIEGEQYCAGKTVFNAEARCARDEVVGLPERSEPEGTQGAARRRVL